VVLFIQVYFVTPGITYACLDAPVLKVAAEGHDTHLVHHMKTTRPVEVQDGLEGPELTGGLETDICLSHVARIRKDGQPYFSVDGIASISHPLLANIHCK
jgi:hypothetical protein